VFNRHPIGYRVFCCPQGHIRACSSLCIQCPEGEALLSTGRAL
jgi:hypothetical protein